MACSLVLGQRATLPDLFLLAGGETVLGEYSRKAYSIDPTSNGIVNEMFDLPLGVSQFGSQNSFAVFHETSVFLAVGFGNGSHSTKSVLNWDRWGSKFSVLYDQTLARVQHVFLKFIFFIPLISLHSTLGTSWKCYDPSSQFSGLWTF